MIQRIFVAFIGFFLTIFQAMQLYALPTSFDETASSYVQGVPLVTSASSRASLYFPKSTVAEAFQTSCNLARSACDWVRKNPGVVVKAKVGIANWPSQSWLIAMSTANDFTLDPHIQEQELASFRRRTKLGLIAVLGVTIALWMLSSRRSDM